MQNDYLEDFSVPPENVDDSKLENATYDNTHFTQPTYVTSHQIAISPGEILKNSATQIMNSFAKILLGWLIFFACSTIVLIAFLFVGSILVTAMVSASTSIINTIFGFGLFILLAITIFAYFVFGLLAFMTNIFETGVADFTMLFSGFSRKAAIFGLVSIIVVPVSIVFIIMTIIFVGQATTGMNPMLSFANVGVLNIITMIIFLIYVSKFVLVPNLILRQDAGLIESIKKSWAIISGKLFGTMILVFGVFVFINIAMQFVFQHFASTAFMRNPGTVYIFIFLYFLANQILFIWILGSVAYIYGRINPPIERTIPLANPVNVQNYATPDTNIVYGQRADSPMAAYYPAGHPMNPNGVKPIKPKTKFNQQPQTQFNNGNQQQFQETTVGEVISDPGLEKPINLESNLETQVDRKPEIKNNQKPIENPHDIKSQSEKPSGQPHNVPPFQRLLAPDPDTQRIESANKIPPVSSGIGQYSIIQEFTPDAQDENEVKDILDGIDNHQDSPHDEAEIQNLILDTNKNIEENQYSITDDYLSEPVKRVEYFDPIVENEDLPIQQAVPVFDEVEEKKPEPKNIDPNLPIFLSSDTEIRKYPSGKIVPVFAIKMMKDPEVSFIEAQFQNTQLALEAMKQISFFTVDEKTNEIALQNDLSFTLKKPIVGMENLPIKLFVGGINFKKSDYEHMQNVFVSVGAKILRQNKSAKMSN